MTQSQWISGQEMNVLIHIHSGQRRLQYYHEMQRLLNAKKDDFHVQTFNFKKRLKVKLKAC